jgi:hypothetical protein
MAAKNTKPAQPSEQSKKAPVIQHEPYPQSDPSLSNSPAKAMQATSSARTLDEPRLPVTLRARNGYEYHIDMARSVAEALLDPDVPDAFIEVPSPIRDMRRFLHTSEIKEIDVRGL